MSPKLCYAIQCHVNHYEKNNTEFFSHIQIASVTSIVGSFLGIAAPTANDFSQSGFSAFSFNRYIAM